MLDEIPKRRLTDLGCDNAETCKLVEEFEIHRKYTTQKFQDGSNQFFEMSNSVAALAAGVDRVTEIVKSMDFRFTTQLRENTELTKATAALSERTALDTADLVRISQFGSKMTRLGRFMAKVTSTGVVALSAFIKIIAPILIVVYALVSIWEGGKITVKEFLDTFVRLFK